MLLIVLFVSLICHVDMVASTLAVTQEQCNDIIHYWSDGRCLSVCDTNWDSDVSCWFDCNDYTDHVYLVRPKPGYWYDNNASCYTKYCPGEFCQNYYYRGWPNSSHPRRDEQCRGNWSGDVCGKCKGNNSTIFGSTKCVSSNHCNKYVKGWSGWLLVFLVTLLYWCIFILLVVVVLHFKFDTSIGYAYGILFYFSVLENVVKQQIIGDVYNYFPTDDQCDLPDRGKFYTYTFEATILSFLTSIGNLKPPFLQFMKLCLHTEVIDHVFFVYTHPVIVVCLLAVIAVAARRFSKLARLVQRQSSVIICLILLLSYSSISYTSVQLLKPLAVYDRFGNAKWHFYWSPSTLFAKEWRVLYVIVAVVCEVIISIGLPLLLLLKPALMSKFNVNLNILKPILDQLQGCYKDEYRWFAAFYLLCRQVIYIADLVSDFLSSSLLLYTTTEKHTSFLVITIIITMIHVWCQPYKMKSLNVVDCAILVALIFAIMASYSYNIILHIFLWFFPLIMFVCYMVSSTKLKHIMIPIVYLGTLASSVSMMVSFDMMAIVIIIALTSLFYLIKFIRDTYRSCRQRCRAGYLEINVDNDYNEELYKRYVKDFCVFNTKLYVVYFYGWILVINLAILFNGDPDTYAI